MLIVKIFFLFFLLGFSKLTLAQQILSSYGGLRVKGGVTINATLGELAIATTTNKNVIISEGFHQPYLKLSNIVEPVNTGLDIFPNPVIDILYIVLNENKNSKIVEMYDLNGGKVMKKKLSGLENSLALNKITSGLYIIKVTDNITNKTYRSRFIKI